MERLVNHINSLPIANIKSDDFTKETILANLTGSSADEVSIQAFARSVVIENVFHHPHHTKSASPEWNDMLWDSDTKQLTLRTRKVNLVLENGSTTVPCFYAHTSDTIKFSIHHPGCINLFYNTQHGTLELDSYFYYSARHNPVCKSKEPISEVKVIEELAKALDALFIINVDVHSYVCSDNNRSGVRSILLDLGIDKGYNFYRRRFPSLQMLPLILICRYLSSGSGGGDLNDKNKKEKFRLLPLLRPSLLSYLLRKISRKEDDLAARVVEWNKAVCAVTSFLGSNTQIPPTEEITTGFVFTDFVFEAASVLPPKNNKGKAFTLEGFLRHCKEELTGRDNQVCQKLRDLFRMDNINNTIGILCPDYLSNEVRLSRFLQNLFSSAETFSVEAVIRDAYEGFAPYYKEAVRRFPLVKDENKDKDSFVVKNPFQRKLISPGGKIIFFNNNKRLQTNERHCTSVEDDGDVTVDGPISDEAQFWGVRYDMGNRPWEHHEHLLLTYFYIASYLQYYCQSHAAISSVRQTQSQSRSRSRSQSRSQSRTRQKKRQVGK
jgi:hypothetical protein